MSGSISPKPCTGKSAGWAPLSERMSTLRTAQRDRGPNGTALELSRVCRAAGQCDWVASFRSLPKCLNCLRTEASVVPTEIGIRGPELKASAEHCCGERRERKAVALVPNVARRSVGKDNTGRVKEPFSNHSVKEDRRAICRAAVVEDRVRRPDSCSWS